MPTGKIEGSSWDLDKLRNFSKWNPDDSADRWTKKHIKKFKGKIWVSSDYSIYFPKYPVDEAIFLDLNLCGRDPIENLSRMVKILDKLGFNIDCDKMLTNFGPTERRIGDKTYPMNQFTIQSNYSDNN